MSIPGLGMWICFWVVVLVVLVVVIVAVIEEGGLGFAFLVVRVVGLRLTVFPHDVHVPVVLVLVLSLAVAFGFIGSQYVVVGAEGVGCLSHA